MEGEAVLGALLRLLLDNSQLLLILHQQAVYLDSKTILEVDSLEVHNNPKQEDYLDSLHSPLHLSDNKLQHLALSKHLVGLSLVPQSRFQQFQEDFSDNQPEVKQLQQEVDYLEPNQLQEVSLDKEVYPQQILVNPQQEDYLVDLKLNQQQLVDFLEQSLQLEVYLGHHSLNQLPLEAAYSEQNQPQEVFLDRQALNQHLEQSLQEEVYLDHQHQLLEVFLVKHQRLQQEDSLVLLNLQEVCLVLNLKQLLKFKTQLFTSLNWTKILTESDIYSSQKKTRRSLKSFTTLKTLFWISNKAIPILSKTLAFLVKSK